MRFECTICPHPQYAAMMAELKANVKRTVVANKYGVSYDALGRCWNEHTPHDQTYVVSESIKRNQKQLNVALKAVPLDRALIKDIETRLKDLRKEQREIQAIQKKENPTAMSGGETPLTVEALDALIAQGPQYNADGDLPIRRLAFKIEECVPRDDWKKFCNRISDLIDTEFAPSREPVQVRKLLPRAVLVERPLINQ